MDGVPSDDSGVDSNGSHGNEQKFNRSVMPFFVMKRGSSRNVFCS